MYQHQSHTGSLYVYSNSENARGSKKKHTHTQISQVLITNFYAPWITVHMVLDPAVPTTNRKALCIIVQLSKLHLINSGTIKHTTFRAKNHSTLTVIYSVSLFSVTMTPEVLFCRLTQEHTSRSHSLRTHWIQSSTRPSGI
jgi:hypothetical protein